MTLAVAPLLMLSICLGVVIRNIQRGESWNAGNGLFYLLPFSVYWRRGSPIVSARAGIVAGVQNLANSGGYLPLVLITSMILPKREDALKGCFAPPFLLSSRSLCIASGSNFSV